VKDLVTSTAAVGFSVSKGRCIKAVVNQARPDTLGLLVRDRILPSNYEQGDLSEE
jgi:hypothetical protein